MSLEEKVGQMFVLFAYGPKADAPDARNTALYGVATPAEVVQKYKPGGWIYFSARGNVTDPVQLATYSNDLQRTAIKTGLRVPLQIATDQEQGVVVGSGRRPPSSAATWPRARPAAWPTPAPSVPSPARNCGRWASTRTTRRWPTSTSTRSTR